MNRPSASAKCDSVLTRAAASPNWRIGQHVHVNHGGQWLAGTINAVSARRLGVSYQHVTGCGLATAVRPWNVRPAHGTQLAPAAALAAGDTMVMFDGTTRTVAAPPSRDRTGRWRITFTDGSFADAGPKAVLRLAIARDHSNRNGRF